MTWGHPVMSTTATAVSAVPTGEKQTSPFTGNSYSAWDVRSNGDVGNDYDFVSYSYGRSPNSHHTNETINAFRISSSGDIDGRNWIFTTGSYGIIRINLSIITEK